MPYPNYHPVYLNLANRSVLIVGGGRIAVEKITSLLGSGAGLTVLSPKVNGEVQAWIDDGSVAWIPKRFEDGDVEPYFMVIAATDDPAVNRAVFLAGEARQKLSNSVDDPENCNFIMAAIVRQGPMQAAISSAGCSPALAQRVRARIRSEILTEEIGLLGEYLGDWRPRLKTELPTYQARQGFWERVIDSPIPLLLGTEGRAAADAEMERSIIWAKGHLGCLGCGCAVRGFVCVSEPAVGRRRATVFLVGAGPGDAGLITVKGIELLRRAEVVLYDRLANPELLKVVPKDAILVDVGKRPKDDQQTKQESINALLVQYGQSHRVVVRLKGGDPYVYGRGGEEGLALRAAGVEFEVVPGISSAIAGPAAAGIPVTHRGVANAFGVFSGHEAEGDASERIAWDAAAVIPTAVFLMGVERLPEIVRQLRAHGRAATTPVAIVGRATHPDQQTIFGTLETIEGLADGMQPPAVIVVGDAVELAGRLA